MDVTVTFTLSGLLKTVIAPLVAIGVGVLIGGGCTMLFTGGRSDSGGRGNAIGFVFAAVGAAVGVVGSMGVCVYHYGWATLGVPIVLGVLWARMMRIR